MRKLILIILLSFTGPAFGASGYICLDTPFTTPTAQQASVAGMFTRGSNDVKLLLRGGVDYSKGAPMTYRMGAGFYNSDTSLLIGIERWSVGGIEVEQHGYDLFYGFAFELKAISLSLVVVDKEPRIGMGFTFGE